MQTADVIALWNGHLVLIERLGTPKGIALPGGKIEGGELPVSTALREFTEETGLTLESPKEFGVYQGKDRDPRFTESRTTVFVGVASGTPKGESGKTKLLFIPLEFASLIPQKKFAFDHHLILSDFLRR